MARPPRVYLAGPEVFLANARAIGDGKRAICTRYGLFGIFPGDAEPPRDPTLTLRDGALAISQAMEAAIRTCDAMIVNLTPFRGVSADVGSVYEMGFMRGLGRPIFGYTHDACC
jgi:nucleoside 2-deoxyribosyltransferase